MIALLMLVAVEAKGQIKLILIYENYLYIDSNSIHYYKEIGFPKARYFIIPGRKDGKKLNIKDIKVSDIREVYEGNLVPQAYHLFKDWELYHKHVAEWEPEAKEEKETKGNK